MIFFMHLIVSSDYAKEFTLVLILHVFTIVLYLPSLLIQIKEQDISTEINTFLLFNQPPNICVHPSCYIQIILLVVSLSLKKKK